MRKLSLLTLSILLMAGCGNKSDKSIDSHPLAELPQPTPQEQPATIVDTGLVNYLKATEVIDLLKLKFNLAWSNPPQKKETYYTQGYLPDGQEIGTYTDQLILSLHNDPNTSLEAEVKEKTDWLESRRRNENPSDDYSTGFNPTTKEHLIDLIISDGDIVEWNIIRYTRYYENGKFAGVKTFTFSKKGYKGVDKFIESMQNKKSKTIKDFMTLPFPKVLNEN